MARILSPGALFARRPATIPPVDTAEKAKVRSGDLFGAYGVKYKADDGTLGVTDYREMLRREPQVKAVVNFKILARLSSGWTIEPASDEPGDVEIADFIRDQFNGLPGGTINGFLRRAMLAMAYGLSVTEIVLQVQETGRWRGKVGLRGLKSKRPDNFRIETDQFGNITGLKYKPEGLGIVEDTLPPEYFVLWAWDHEGDYQGLSELRPAYRYAKAKELLQRIWNVFLERYATPTPLGKFKRGTAPTEQDAILNFLSGLHAKKAAVVPDDWGVTMLESLRTGGDYEAALRYCDKMISRALLLPTLIVDEGDHGAYALGSQHTDNFTWVLQALGEESANDIVGAQLIHRLVDWNFEVEAYPKFTWKPYTAADFEKLTTAFTSLVSAGILPAEDPIIRQRLELPAATAPAPDASPRGEKAAAAGTPAKGEEAPGARGVNLAAPESTGGRRHRRKADWQAVREGLDGLERPAVDSMAAAVVAMRDGLVTTLQKRQIIENRDEAAVDKLQLKGVGEFRTALENCLGNALHLGAYHARLEVERGLADAGKPMKLDLGDSMGVNFTADAHNCIMLPDGRLHFLEHGRIPASWDAEHPEANFAQDLIVRAWAKKIPVQRALLRSYTRAAFTITGVYRKDLLEKAQLLILKGIRRGATFAQVEQELNNLFAPYLSVPGAVDPAVARAYRLENIVRTNMSEAYNTGRWNLYNHKDVRGFIEAYEYCAIVDDRTTQFCMEWDGHVIRADDPRLAGLNPPNHWMCRSVLIAIVTGEKFQVDSDYPGLSPMEGFSI